MSCRQVGLGLQSQPGRRQPPWLVRELAGSPVAAEGPRAFVHGQLEAAEIVYEGDEMGWSDDDCVVVVESVQVDEGVGGGASKRARTHE